jgi:hypothetical protein
VIDTDSKGRRYLRRAIQWEQTRAPIMPRRQQFRTHAEYCLRLAELINSPEQKVSLNATANAWHRFAQELDLRGEPVFARKKEATTDRPSALTNSPPADFTFVPDDTA